MKAFSENFRSIETAAVFFLFVFSGLYTTKLGISPIYLGASLGLLMAAYSAISGWIKASLFNWVMLMGVLLISCSFAIVDLDLDVKAQNIFNFMLGPLLGETIYLVGRKLPRERILALVKPFITTTLLLCTAEAIYRLTHPDFDFLQKMISHNNTDFEELAFYAYKFNSFMYIDSNFVGIQLVTLEAFVLAANFLGARISRWFHVWGFLLICATLSRASIVTTLALYFASFASTSKTFRKLLFPALIAGAPFAIFFFQGDRSFGTKFEIFDAFSNYAQHARLDQLLSGVGLGMAAEYLGIGSHLMIVTYAMEVGFVMTFLILLYWYRLVRITPYGWLLVLGLVINGVSLTTLAIPYFYSSLAILRLLQPRLPDTEPYIGQSSY